MLSHDCVLTFLRFHSVIYQTHSPKGYAPLGRSHRRRQTMGRDQHEVLQGYSLVSSSIISSFYPYPSKSTRDLLLITFLCSITYLRENHIKNRWYSASFKKFVAKEFGPEVYEQINEGSRKATGSGKVQPLSPISRAEHNPVPQHPRYKNTPPLVSNGRGGGDGYHHGMRAL